MVSAAALDWQDLLFGAKTEFPELGEPYVPRPRLHMLLEQAARKRLTTMVAGEGAGKTLSLSSYARGRAEGTVTWYTADDLDETALDLLRGLKIALHGQASRSQQEIGVLSEIVAAIKQRAQRLPLLIVIDEVHKAPAAAVAMLLRYLPNEARLLIAGRGIPNGLEELVDWYRAHNQLASLGASDLVLDATEAAAFARAYGHASGQMPWAGAYALALPLADYLSQRMLPSISDDLCRLVAPAAVLTSFTAQQFQALTGGRCGPDVLDMLLSTTPLLCRHGEDYEWAPGAAEVLLALLSEERRCQAHLQAGQLLLTLSPLRAARSFVSAGAPEFAAQALDVAPSWAWTSLPTAAADVLQALPPAALASHPALLLARARAALVGQTPLEAAGLLAHVQPRSPAEEVELLALGARAALAGGQACVLENAHAEIQALGHRLRGVDGDAAVNALIQAATLAGLAGRPSEAIADLRLTLDLLATGAASAQQQYLTAFARTSLGMAVTSEGDVRSAMPILERAVQEAREQGDGIRLDEATNNLAICLSGAGQWAKAVLVLHERLGDETTPRPPALRTGMLSTLADLCATSGEDERAIRLYRETLASLRDGDPYGLAPHNRASLCLLLGRRGLYVEAQHELELLTAGAQANHQGYAMLAGGVLAFLNGRYAEAMATLTSAAASPTANGLQDEVRVRLWLALVHHKAGDTTTAAAALEPLSGRLATDLGPADEAYFADVLALHRGTPVRDVAGLAPTLLHALRRPPTRQERPERLAIRLLGTPQLIVDGEPVGPTIWTSERALELFSYLVTRRKPIRREEIVAHLLPWAEQERARQQLSNMLSRLRRAVRLATGLTGDPVLCDERDRCSLDLAALADNVSIDVDELEGWSRDVRDRSWTGPIAPLLRLTDGEFLEGFQGEWLLPYRRAYADIGDLALEHALERCEASGRLQDSLVLAERLSALNPESEQATRRLSALRRATTVSRVTAAGALQAS